MWGAPRNSFFVGDPYCVTSHGIAKNRLLAQGHIIVPFSPPDVPDAFILLQAESGFQSLNDIREPLNASYPHFSLTWSPVRVRHSSAALLAYSEGTNDLSLYLRSAPASTAQMRNVNERILDYLFDNKFYPAFARCQARLP